MTVLDKLTDVISNATDGRVSVSEGAKEVYECLVKEVAPYMGLGQSDIDFMITRLHKRYTQTLK